MRPYDSIRWVSSYYFGVLWWFVLDVVYGGVETPNAWWCVLDDLWCGRCGDEHFGVRGLRTVGRGDAVSPVLMVRK
jgi:hypothetical protein